MPSTITTNLCKNAVDGTTVNSSNIISTNRPTLVNQLKDWKLCQKDLIICNIPETELVNQQDIKTNLVSKFKELVTEKCNVRLCVVDLLFIVLFYAKPSIQYPLII